MSDNVIEFKRREDAPKRPRWMWCQGCGKKVGYTDPLPPCECGATVWQSWLSAALSSPEMQE